MSHRVSAILASAIVVASSAAVRGQAPDDRVALVVAAGRPLRVRVNERVTIKRVGQIVTATVIDPVYAYDRVVIPSGATVTGHIEKLESPSRWSRARAMLAGDFTPQHTPVVQFDTLTLPDGTRMPIATTVGAGREGVTLSTTTASKKTGVVERGKQEAAGRAKEAIAAAKHRVHDAIATVKARGKMERIKEAAIGQLPYHPQYLHAGTVYTAELVAPVSFGEVPAAERASPDDRPSPESVLTARLVTPLDSANTPKGTAMQAVLAEPVFSADHRLIVPEGATLDGEVTFAKRAASLHRNGQLRFLVERIHEPERESKTLLASLYAVEARQADRLVVDDEGGAAVTNSKTRFIAPALAVMSLHAAVEQEHRRFDNDADDNEAVLGPPGVGGRGLAGWFGFGLLGAGLGQISRPVAIAFGVYGATRTMYSSILGKGHDVVFPANTVIQVQLSPRAGDTPQ
jgi:hypothetical protein